MSPPAAGPGRHMLSEIREQPEVLARLLAREARKARRLGDWLRARPPAVAVLAARGSSDHAAALGKYLIEWATGVPAALAAPSMATLYRAPLRLSGALVVGVSQSGRSPDIVEYLRSARRAGALTVAVTNEERSPLAAAAEETLLCRAGPERSVAATKTFTAQLACLSLLAASWADGPRGRTLSAGLERAPERLARTVGRERDAERLASRLAAAVRCAVLGRGFAYPAALEIALKLKESAGLAADGGSAADFLHGPIAAAGPGLTALLLGPRGPGLPSVRRVAARLRATGAELLSLSAEPKLEAWSTVSADPASGWPEPLSAFPLVAVGQLAAYHLAVRRGLDPDSPVGLAKVTRTW